MIPFTHVINFEAVGLFSFIILCMAGVFWLVDREDKKYEKEMPPKHGPYAWGKHPGGCKECHPKKGGFFGWLTSLWHSEAYKMFKDEPPPFK